MQIKNNLLSKKAVWGLVIAALFSVGCVFTIYSSARGTQTPRSTQGNNTSQTSLNQYQSQNLTDKSSASKTKTTTSVNPDCVVKAKTSKNGKKLFYLPNNKSYSRVTATECFKTADEAVAAGYQNASQK